MIARVLAALIPLSVLAPAVAAPMPATIASCTALLSHLAPMLPPPFIQPDQVTAPAPDTCHYANIHLNAATRAGWEIASVTVRGAPAGALGTEKMDLRMEADGIISVLHSGRPAFDWMSRQQQIPSNVVLDVSYDPATKLLALHELSLHSDLGWTSLDGVVENVEPTDPSQPAARPPVEARVTALHVHLQSKRFLVNSVVPFIVGLMGDRDPEPIVSAVKAEIIGKVVMLLPDVPRDTVAAITSFVKDFPHPQHPFDLSLQAEGPGFGIDILDLLHQSDAAQIARLKQLKVQASYSGDLP